MRTPQASPPCSALSTSFGTSCLNSAREGGARRPSPVPETDWFEPRTRGRRLPYDPHRLYGVGAPKVLGVEIVLDVPDATSKRDAIVYYEVSYTAERVIAESLYRLRSTDEEAVFIRDGQDVELYCDLDGNDFVQAVARTVQRNRLLLEVLANSEADEVGGGVAGVIQWFKRLTVIRSS